LLYSTLLAAVPATVEWSPKVAIVMAASCLLAIAFAKATVKEPSVGPVLAGNFVGGFSLPAVTAAWSLGHVIGIGAILGLAQLGVL